MVPRTFKGYKLSMVLILISLRDRRSSSLLGRPVRKRGHRPGEVDAAGGGEERVGAAEGHTHPAVVWPAARPGHAALHGAAQSKRNGSQPGGHDGPRPQRLQALPHPVGSLLVPVPGNTSTSLLRLGV